MRLADRLLACLPILALLAACSAGGNSASPGATVTPSPVIDEPALVYGTQTCGSPSADSRTEGGNTIFLEHFRCTYAVNDPRLDGATMDGDFTTTFEPTGAAAARWEATVTITNDEGSWSGESRGALVFWTTGPDSVVNYGRTTYTGSGAYEGLVYDELIAGNNTVLTVSGSIEPG